MKFNYIGEEMATAVRVSKWKGGLQSAANIKSQSSGKMEVVKEETMKQKGPWSEQEDLQLVCFVRLFGERRWDFIAKVSGLNRTGKSCRLRWVNYLHPGLKHGHLTPQEEHLILELHSRWGNRWSRIASRLPGRTDNEIKNYWRTHMRKMARERKRNDSPLPSSLMTDGKSPSSGELDRASPELNSSGDSSYKTMGLGEGSTGDGLECYSMDQIWEEIEISETMTGISSKGNKGKLSNAPYPPLSSPAWDCYYDWLWKADDEELSKLQLHQVG